MKAKKKSKCYNIVDYLKHWRGQKSEDDKGGSFNTELYIRICEIKYLNYGEC
jgi:hypothetical protein